MKISVKAKPCSREEKIEKIPQNSFAFLGTDEIQSYKVWVKEKPENGEANEAVIKLLAKHFGVHRSDIKIIIGEHSSQKVFEIASL